MELFGADVPDIHMPMQQRILNPFFLMVYMVLIATSCFKAQIQLAYGGFNVRSHILTNILIICCFLVSSKSLFAG